MEVNICGIPHKVLQRPAEFTSSGIDYGEIKYAECAIKINCDLPEELKKEVLCHEMVHRILFHIGRYDLYDDERLVQALGNAIYQGFDIKEND